MILSLRKTFICLFKIFLGNALLTSRVGASLEHLDSEDFTVKDESPTEQYIFHGEGSENENFEVVQQPPNGIKVPYTSSPLYLTQLAQAEQHIYEKLTEYEKQLKQRLEILQRLRTDYESSALAAIRKVQTVQLLDDWSKASIISSHPVLSFRMLRRFVKYLEPFTTHIWQSLENELWESLELRRGKFEWPSQKDLIAATKSLIRLQDTYDFDLKQFADGAIRDLLFQSGLTAEQCLEISGSAMEIGEINAATEWFQVAHYKGTNGLDNSITIDDLTPAWTRTYQAFQSIWPMQIFQTHDVFQEAKEMLQSNFDRVKTNLTKEHQSINFKALCRGDKLLSEERLLALTCYLENTIHPYYFMNPLRVEVFSWNPLVYQVHDFVGAKTLETLSNVVVPLMASSVEQGDALLQADSTSKTYTYNSILDIISPQLSELTAKVRVLPGLNSFQLETLTGEKYQISSFAVGNHYEPCKECFNLEETYFKDIGRTVSAVHIVLHEPQMGGEFAFPQLGVSVTSLIGSAIVYNAINLFDNGEPTVHGGCPVLIGEKWIATKLIYEVSNDPITQLSY